MAPKTLRWTADHTRTCSASSAPSGRARSERREVVAVHPGVEGDVGGHQGRGEAGAQNRDARVGIRTQVVIDARRGQVLADPHLAHVAAHDRDSRDALGELRIEHQRPREIRDRPDQHDLQAWDLPRRAHDALGARPRRRSPPSRPRERSAPRDRTRRSGPGREGSAPAHPRRRRRRRGPRARAARPRCVRGCACPARRS